MIAIVTKYLGPTNTRDSRVKATTPDGKTVTIPYPYELSGEAVHRAAVTALCGKCGWEDDSVAGWLGSGMVFVGHFPTKSK